MRAAQAVALFAGFYLLAALVIVVLVAIPVLEYAATRRVIVQLWAFSLGGAWAVAWGVAPRFDRFDPPGPRLLPAAQPRLFEVLTGLARETRQPMPQEVYLVLDVNAFVAQRGGIMGFGSRPVMGLGLPLLQVLSVSELEAVIAHEFGHYAGSDTRLAPWVYKTRLAIGRTVGSVKSSIVRAPFELYGKLFMSVTQAVSRSQELSADALAARIAGASALVGSLRRIAGAAPAYRLYWQNFFGPLLQAGYQAPFAAGFASYTNAPVIAKFMADTAAELAKSGKPADPNDTHPSLAEREAALAQLGDVTARELRTQPALSLLDGVTELEGELLDMCLVPELRDKLRRPIAWDDAGMTHWAPLWQEVARQHEAELTGFRVRDIDALLANRAQLDQVLRTKAPATPEERRGEQEFVLFAALITRLVQAGWTLQVTPGYEAVLRRYEVAFRPASLVRELAAQSETGRESWQRILAETWIGDLPLGRDPAPPA